MRRTGALFLFALVSIPRAAWPQGDPLGPEFRVNTYTTFNQANASIASDSSGNFVVVWPSYTQDGSGYGIFGQRYAASGASLGLEFRVNTYTTSTQGGAAVASDASGKFVVVWSSFQYGSYSGVFGQRYAASGVSLGLEFRVNTYTTDNSNGPSVAADSLGNFIVVWASSGIFGQRYAASGAPLGPEFRINTYTTAFQFQPSVAADSVGNFVVVWQSYLQDGSYPGIFGQRYASSGAPLGPEFRVNTYTTGWQDGSAVASDSSGNFVVVWESEFQDGYWHGIFGQRFASSGAPLGPEFRINTYTTKGQRNPSVTSDASGNFVVVWKSQQDGSGYGVFGQRYASSGAPSGPEFRVNTYTPNSQGEPSVAADPSGNFVVVWQGQLQDGSGYGVFGQRYSQIVPVELMRFTVE